MKLKTSVDFDTIRQKIQEHFGPIFEIEFSDGYVIVSGDLHDYRKREKLFEIITQEKVVAG